MKTSPSPEREHAVLGQKYAFAAASLVLGIASFINLLGFEKAVLAVAFGWLALKSLPGPALAPRRRWAQAGMILGLLHMLLLSVILVLARDRVVRLLEQLGDLSSNTRLEAAGAASQPSYAVAPGPEPKRVTQSNATAGPPANVQPHPDRKAFNWRQVESEDYRQYIANLRAIGCPDQTVRDIIVADVNQLFRERARSQHSGTNRFEYWRSGNPIGNLMTPEKVAQRQEVADQKRQLLRALLGADASNEPDTTAMLNPMIEALDFLPSDKVSSLMEMEQRYQARVMEAMKQASQGEISELKQILAEHDAETLQVLTPQEKLEYDVRLSPTAARLRLQMGDFSPTEEEFRKLAQLQKAFEDEFSPLGLASSRPEDQQSRETARLKLDREIESVLGADRYAQYRQ